METKMLNFDMNDENQKEAYLQLDRVRYYQTRFITKLVNDFFRSHNITLDTPYFDTKKLVKSYINGYFDFTLSEQTKSSGNETINILLANMVQQQTLFQQQIANMMVNAKPGIYVGEPNNQTPEPYQSSDLKTNQKDSDCFKETISSFDEDGENSFLDDDDFDDDLDISGLSSGFANMSQ